MNFSEWLALSDENRKADQAHWQVFEPGYWHSLAVEAAARFAAEFNGNKHVTKVFKSLYHARELVVAVQTDLKPPQEIAALPPSYLGFRVMQFPSTVPDGVLVDPGPPSKVRKSKRAREGVAPRPAPVRSRSHATDQHRLLTLEGEIDLHSSPQMMADLNRFVKEKPRKLIVDLTKASYIDSSGLAALIDAMQKVKAYGGMLYLVGMRETVRVIFETSRLDQAFKILPDVAGAVAAD